MATKKKNKKEELVDDYKKSFEKAYGVTLEGEPVRNEYSVHVLKNSEVLLAFNMDIAPHVNYYLEEGYAKISWDIE